MKLLLHIKMNKLPLCVLFLGSALIVTFTVLTWVLQPLFMGEQVVQGIRIFYGAHGGADMWQKLGLPTYEVLDPGLLKVFLFNVTNPHEIIRDGMKPILKQVGPYVYTIEKIVENIPTNETATTTFKEKNIYHFNPLHSGLLKEQDVITVLNIPFLQAVETLRQDELPKTLGLFTSIVLSGNQETVFISKSVSELLFEGFSQPSLEKTQMYMKKSTKGDGKDKFRYLKNNTVSGIFTASAIPAPVTELDGRNVDFAEIVNYNGQQELGFWADTPDGKCNEIKGTVDGMLFKPLRDQGMSMSIFRPQICRSLNFHLNGQTEFYDRLVGYRFVLGREQLLDSSINFANNCFCPKPGLEVEIRSCVQAGTLSNCRQDGTPYITTLPHFLNSDGTDFLTQVVGLSPNQATHESFIDLEPITGLALTSSVKLQMNYYLRPSSSHEDLKSVPKILFPILWTEEVKSMNQIMKQTIQEKIIKPIRIIDLTKWAVLVIGLLMTVLGALIWILRRRKKKYPV